MIKCPSCGSLNTAAGLQNYSCTDCGALNDGQGNTVEPGIDATTRQALLNQLQPRQISPVGNLADLQRLGHEIVMPGTTNTEGAFVHPPGMTAEALQRTAKAEAEKEKLIEDGALPAEVNAPPHDHSTTAAAAKAAASVGTSGKAET